MKPNGESDAPVTSSGAPNSAVTLRRLVLVASCAVLVFSTVSPVDASHTNGGRWDRQQFGVRDRLEK